MSLGVAALGAAAFRSGIVPLQGARGWLCSLLSKCNDLHGSFSGLTLCRRQHMMPERQSASIVPEAILQELHGINSFLAADSHLDGRRRSSLRLSADALPAPLPPHAVEADLPTLEAHVRPPRAEGGMARCAVKWLKRSGRVPGQVHSILSPAPPAPGTAAAAAGTAAGATGAGGAQQGEAAAAAGAEAGERGEEMEAGLGPGGRRVWELNVHFDERDLARMVRTFGRNGCTARVLQIKLVRPPQPAAGPPAQQQQQPLQQQQPAGHSGAGSAASSGGGGGGEVLGVLRVKPVRVHMNAVNQRVEGIEMIYCPPDRVVLVDVPLRLANDEMAPGVRKGGWMNMFKRTVRYKALGNAIPPFIEVNVRHLGLDQDLLVRDLPVPPGTKIYEKNFNAPVVRCTTDVGKD